MHAVFRKSIDFEIVKNDKALIWFKKEPEQPNISYKPFWVYATPLNSWKADSPNPSKFIA